jgi:lysophospholipase L1-like esterase
MLGAVGVALVGIECAVELVLNHPGVLLGQPHLVSVARYYHRGRDWQVIQADPRCVRWDAELGYMLRPPGCTISDREFTVDYAVNSQGLRDDEESLRDPAIVVAGDSYAMGWGVAHDESFAERVGQALGVRVLNTGITSYDTARELALLARLGIQSARVVVIQYCSNDDPANRIFVDEGRLLALPEARFAAELEEAQRFRRRYFGKNLVTIGTRIFTGPSDRGGGVPGDPKSAYYFLETLRRYQSLLAGKVVVVLTESSDSDAFIAAGRALLADPRYAELAAIVSFVDPGPELEGQPSHYPLDGHLNATGHAQEAAAIVAELRRRGVRFAGG